MPPLYHRPFSAHMPEEHYNYPEHLRESLAGMPNTPGVYTFHGEKLPLYIGKSINLRTRVLSHFRNIKEARLLQQTREISFIPTAGELGALLLEASMIKTYQPLFNKRLRKNRQLCSLQLTEHHPQLVYAKTVNFAHTENLFGLFANRHRALEALHQIADTQQLCLVRMGLESRPANQRCFRASLGRCSGVCYGKDTPSAHDARMALALEGMRITCWPWKGAVAVMEESTTLRQYHVVNHWFYLGSASTLAQARKLKQCHSGFDSDGYKILCKPLLSGRYEAITLA
ncbi:MAG: Excinuclease cho [Candidatus Erwinia impunctatus]